MEIKNQEDRTAAIWRFVAMAAPVALLLFLGGLLMGNTFKSVEKDCAANLQATAERAAVLENRLATERLFFQKGDSLVKAFVPQFDQLDAKLADVGADPLADLDLLNKVDFERIEMDGKLAQQLKVLETEFSPADTLAASMKTGLHYLREYAGLYNKRVQKKIADMKSLALKGQTDELKELQKLIEAQKREAEGAISDAGDRARLDELQMKLDRCKEDLTRAQAALNGAGGGGSTGRDNSADVAKILQEVETVKKEIIPQMPGGLLGKKKALKEELRGYLDAISAAAQKIK